MRTGEEKDSRHSHTRVAIEHDSSLGEVGHCDVNVIGFPTNHGVLRGRKFVRLANANHRAVRVEDERKPVVHDE
jgi:hypothetical protein